MTELTDRQQIFSDLVFNCHVAYISTRDVAKLIPVAHDTMTNAAKGITNPQHAKAFRALALVEAISALVREGELPASGTLVREIKSKGLLTLKKRLIETGYTNKERK